MSDLNQQIQDLKFYVRYIHAGYVFLFALCVYRRSLLSIILSHRARKEVQESPLKDELKTGTVVTSQRNPPPQASIGNNYSSGLGGDKKVAKRK